jgi:hypothetical protein
MESHVVYHPASTRHLDRAIAGYERVHGPDAPAASRSGSYKTEFNNKSYIVVGNTRRILSCYRLRNGGLSLMAHWPRQLDERHHEHVMRSRSAQAPQARSG